MIKRTWSRWASPLITFLLMLAVVSIPPPPGSPVSHRFNDLFAQGNSNLANYQVRAQYGTSNQTITCTIASLTSDTTGAITGRNCAAISNTTNKFSEVLVFIKVKTGGSGTTSAGYVALFASGSADGGTTYTENSLGTDAGFTLTDPPNMRVIGLCNTVANSTTYYCGPFRLTPAFGGVVPSNWAIFVQNGSGGTLDSTGGNHAIFYQGIFLGQ